MIFSSAMVRAIATGRKTMTRRPAKPSDTECRYKPGKSYAVQPGRGRSSDGVRLVVTDVRTELLGLITYDDARAEGFKTRAEFMAYWVALHDRPWLQRQIERFQSDQAALGDEAYARRFDAHHADRLVWVIRFELDHEHRPRLLHRQSERGYTTNPAEAMRVEHVEVGVGVETSGERAAHQAKREVLIAEAEAVPPSVIDGYAKANTDRHAAHRAGVDDALLAEERTLEGRLRTLRDVARERGVDIRNEVRVVERRLDAIEAKIRAQRAGRAA
jgi:hypothetical protein